MLTLNSNTVAYSRIGGRAAQFVFCLIGLSTTSAALKFGSSAAVFTILMTYTGMLLGLWYLGAIEVYHYCPRPQLMMERGLDGLMAFMLLIAAIVLGTSWPASDCNAYHFQCGNLHAGVAFSVLGMVAFLLTLGLTFVQTETFAPSEMSVSHGNDASADYREERTPTNNTNLSPLGADKQDPVAHV